MAERASFGSHQPPSRTALIVDDSKLARIVMARALENVGKDWKRVEASSADEAIEAIARQRIDVVFIDYNMPGTNGLELLAEIRKAHPVMPAAIVTANVQHDIVAGAQALNAGFITKPISADNVRSFVERAIKE